jgi:hypothetical protein
MASKLNNHIGRDNYGEVFQAARDINYEAYVENHIEPDDPWDEMFTGRGAGRVMMVIGLIVLLCGFGGWMLIIFSGFSSHDPSAPTPFDKHLLGVPVPAIAFGAILLGGVVAGIGRGISRAARRREESRRPTVHRPPARGYQRHGSDL